MLFRSVHLRTALAVRLKHEGNQVTIVKRKANQVIRERLRSVRSLVRLQAAESLVAAEALSYADVLMLQEKAEKMSLSPAEQTALARFWLADFYGLSPEALTTEEVLWDGEGKRRAEITELEALLHPHLADERTLKGLEKQNTWNQGNTPWDLSGAAMRMKARQGLGLLAFLEWAAEGHEWFGDDDAISSRADLARQCASDIKLALRFSIRPSMSDVQILHQLLSQVGIKFMRRFVRGDGKGRWCYRLDQEHWERVKTILQRRAERRKRIEDAEDSSDPPLKLTPSTQGGDQSHTPTTKPFSIEAKRSNVSGLPLEATRDWESENSA